MTGIFENAKFGTVFETKNGEQAVYLRYIPYDNVHKLFVDGFEYPFHYYPDGRRKGGGKYAHLYGSGLDISKIAS